MPILSIMKQPPAPGVQENLSTSWMPLKICRLPLTMRMILIPKEVILLGSSYSASLALLEGLNHPKVGAVIAFSPGEYFGKDLRLEDSLKTCSKPLFVAVTKREQPYVKQMLTVFSEDDYTLFQPDTLGVHGARALWDDNPTKDEYWLALLMFINNLNK